MAVDNDLAADPMSGELRGKNEMAAAQEVEAMNASLAEWAAEVFGGKN